MEPGKGPGWFWWVMTDGRWMGSGCLEAELIGHGCEGRNQGGLLAFERPEHLGRWWEL